MKDFFYDFFWDGSWCDRILGTMLLICVLILSGLVGGLVYVVTTDKHFHYMASKIEYMEVIPNNNEYCQVNPNEAVTVIPTHRIDSCVLCHEVFNRNIGYDFNPSSKFAYTPIGQSKWKMPKKPQGMNQNQDHPHYFPVIFPMYVKSGNPIYVPFFMYMP